MSHSPYHSAAGSLLCGEDASEVVSFDADASISDEHLSPSSSLVSYSPSSDETTIERLIDVETHHMPDPDYPQRCRNRFIDVTARQDSINWILKRPSGWPFQLLSVACLSLAAKMEEPEVPPLLDLQLFEPRFVFEPKTIQRMEVWVMTNLNWRLRSVTPFDYLDYFISKLPSPSTREPESVTRLFSAASDLILSTTRVIDFLGFAPSTMAATAVLCSARQGHADYDINHKSALCFHDRVNKEMVRSCHQLMKEYVMNTCHAACHKGRGAEHAAPSSPVGVLDAATCGSCDTRSENPGSSCQAEPPNKRLRSSAPDVQQR